MKPTRYRKTVDTLLLTLLGIALIGPVFKVKYLDNWSSIESTFIADARMLAGSLPHPNWQPLWYCGTRFDYIYPPAVRYGTALIALLGHASTAKGYHIYIGLLYVFGLVSVYWLVMVGSRSRAGAWLSAVAVALLSPCLILSRALGNDSPWMIPQRLHVLMTYGEGPHISALSVLPAALAASFVALRTWRPAALALAAVLCAATVANNFYGATSLAISFPIVIWAVWLGLRDRLVLARAGGIVALTWGLSAFWLTPSYVRVTLMNLKWVSAPADPMARLFMAGAILLFCLASYRLANRRPDRSWAVFVTGAALIFTVDVLAALWFSVRVVGDPVRLSPEMDMALLLLMVLLITALWKLPRLRIVAAVLTVVMFIPARVYLQHAYSPFPRAASWEDQYERRIAKWVASNLPGERVMASGSIRFWYDAWFDLPQTMGGSDQGMLNQGLPASVYQIYHHDRGDISVLWLQALGTSAVIVPDATSPEVYHDYNFAGKFRGLVPTIFDDQHGTAIYRIPRIYRSIGRVVDRAKIMATVAMTSGVDVEALKNYVSVIEAPQPETSVTWSGFDAVRINANVAAGQVVLLQETYDPEWRAYENGKQLPIRPEQTLGFMLIDPGPGNHLIEMRFDTPVANRMGQVLLAISLLATGGLLMCGWRLTYLVPRKLSGGTW